MKIFVVFFKFSLNLRAHALQSELNKVWYTKFGKFQLQSMSSKIERAFEKQQKMFLSSFCQLQLYRDFLHFLINFKKKLFHILNLY